MPEAKPPPPHPLDILLLTLVAGSADALGYLNLGKVFTSNMTGNVVLLGIAVSEGRGNDTGRSLFALLAFIVGTCIGAWLLSRFAPKENPHASVTGVLGCEAVLLLVYALLSTCFTPERQVACTYPLIALLASSMGLQASVFYRLGTPGVITTAITGTMTTLFTGLMKTLVFLPAPPAAGQRRNSAVLLQILVLLLYCGGAAISGLTVLHARAWAGLFPALLITFAVTTRLLRRN